MAENVTDDGLLDLSGIRLSESLEESALAEAVRRALASSEHGPSTVFRLASRAGRFLALPR